MNLGPTPSVGLYTVPSVFPIPETDSLVQRSPDVKSSISMGDIRYDLIKIEDAEFADQGVRVQFSSVEDLKLFKANILIKVCFDKKYGIKTENERELILAFDLKQLKEGTTTQTIIEDLKSIYNRLKDLNQFCMNLPLISSASASSSSSTDQSIRARTRRLSIASSVIQPTVQKVSDLSNMGMLRRYSGITIIR